MFLWVIIISFFGLALTSILYRSNYIQTEIYYEPQTCQESGFYNLLRSVESFSMIHCTLLCSTTKDCRRIMFDGKTKICSMFESGENCYSHENLGDKTCFKQKSVCSEVNCIRCPIGYHGGTCQHIIQDCSDGSQKNVTRLTRLMTYIQPGDADSVLEVKCDFAWGGMTFIQLRQQICSEIDFNRSWSEYENGFGYKHGEYWLGLKHVYDILQNNNNKFELQILVNIDGKNWQGYYRHFTISNSTDGYKFSSQMFHGNSIYPIGDSLTNGSYSIEGRPFSTYDRDYSNNNCPDRFKGGWWYLDDHVCSRANLNGRRRDPDFEATIHWLDDFGQRNDITEIHVRLTRILV